MNPELYASYKILGLISFVATWFVMLFLLIQWRGSSHSSFSMKAAESRKIYYFYLGLVIFTLPLLFLFMTEWFIPTYHLPPSVTVMVYIQLISQIATTLISVKPGVKKILHKLFAYIMALCMALITFSIVNADQISISARFIATLMILLMFLISSTLIFFGKIKQYFLYFQALYVICFQISVIAATYL